jgi:acyl-homoserine-lactone acylase
VLTALAQAVTNLATAGFQPNVTLRDCQFTIKGTETIPIHGGTNLEGAFNIVGYNGDSGTLLKTMPRGQVITAGSGLTADGYPISVGSSFMMALEYLPDGPHAQAVVSYSESSDPASPHYADQTHLFSESKYRPVLFTEDEIKADPKLQVIDLTID